jgi:polyribonucleotide 5'-hydroxyl-kinase
LGAQSKSDPLKPAPVAVVPELAHALLAVSHATSPDQLATANVAGFVLVTAVDAARGLVTYLAPCGGALPGRYLLLGSLRAFLD